MTHTVETRQLELPANWNYVKCPLDFTPHFSHFYSVNSNSNNSKSPLNRTKYHFSCHDQKFTEMYPENSNCLLGCHPISSSFCIVSKSTSTDQHWISLVLIGGTNRSCYHFWWNELNLHCTIHWSAKKSKTINFQYSKKKAVAQRKP